MKFCYISTGNVYPMNKHLIDGLRENNHEVFELNETSQDFRKYIRIINRLRAEKKNCDAIIVGYPSPIFVLIARCVSLKKIIFNAVSSQYEANIVSRGLNKPWSLIAIKWWIIDFISFHLSSKILLESNAQIDFIHKLFFIPRKKLVKSWMGVNEEVFFYDPTVKKRGKFTVLFRGRFLPESGILTVIKTAKKLEKEELDFLVLGHGFSYKEVNKTMKELNPQNLIINSETLSSDNLRKIMLSCHVSLGQLANHPRLLRTLPCKLFESLALRLPFLTGRNPGVLELLKENETCIAVNPNDTNDLAKKILYLRDNPDLLEKVASQGYKLHKEKLTSKQLAKEFVEKCF